MKAITIHQPWASLIASGAKRFETRGWRTNYRGPIAIHASKSLMYDYRLPKLSGLLYNLGFHKFDDFPVGRVLAIADLVSCHKITQDRMSLYGEEMAVTDTGLLIEGDEWMFGDYAEGRYAWELTDVKMLPEPIPAKGQQGLWNWEG